MSHHADLIQLARQVDLYRRYKRFDLDIPALLAIVDRVLRRDPSNNDARRVRKLADFQRQHWTWRRLGLARITQFLWPESLVVEHAVTPETHRLRAFSLLTPASALGVVVAALTCVAILWDAHHAWIPKLWILGFLLVLGVRLRYAGQIRRRIATRSVHRGDLDNLQTFGVLFGLLWGGLILATPHLDPSGDVVLPVVFVGACVMSGALTTYFVIPGASPIYACLVGFPLIYAGAAHSSVVGMLAAFYTLWTVVSAFVHQRLFTHNVDRTQALLHQRDKLDTALAATSAGAVAFMWQTDAALRLCGVDDGFAEAHHASAGEMNGRNFVDLFGAPLRRSAGGSLATLEVTLALRKTFNSVRIVSHDGVRLRHWELSGAPRFDSDARFVGYQGVCGEIGPARPAPSLLDDYADDLTGLPRLWALRPRIEESLVKAQHGRALCAATLIAVDGLGESTAPDQHRATILLIAEAASRMRAVVDKGEVAYLGSGRFLMFYDSFVRVDELVEQARKVVTRLSGCYDLHDARHPTIRAFGGIALGPVESASLTILLEQAKSALEEAYREPDGVHVYRRRSPRPIVSLDELRSDFHTALRNNAIFPRYSLILDLTTRQPVAVSLELLWESARHGRLDPAMIQQIATDVISKRWLSDYVTGRLIPAAWPVAGTAALCVDAGLLDVTDTGLKTKLAAAIAAARTPQAAIEVIVGRSPQDDAELAAALDLAGPAIFLGLGAAVALAEASHHPQPVTSIWLPHSTPDVAAAIARAKVHYRNLRRVVAEGVPEADAMGQLHRSGFTSVVGLSHLMQITADDAISFAQPDKSCRSNG